MLQIMIQDLVWPVQFRIIESHIVATFLIRLTWIWHKLSLINITAVHVCCCSAAVWCCICFDVGPWCGMVHVCCNLTNSDATRCITLQSCQSLCNHVLLLQSARNWIELLWLWKDNGQCFGLEEHQVQFLCNQSNLSETSQNYLNSTIQSQSSRLQISRSRLREDCDHPKELVLGIAGHWEDCKGPSSLRLGLPSTQGSDLTNSC